MPELAMVALTALLALQGLDGETRSSQTLDLPKFHICDCFAC